MFTVSLRHKGGVMRRKVYPFFGTDLFRYIDTETAKGHTVLYIGVMPSLGRLMPQEDVPGESLQPMSAGSSFGHFSR